MQTSNYLKQTKLKLTITGFEPLHLCGMPNQVTMQTSNCQNQTTLKFNNHQLCAFASLRNA